MKVLVIGGGGREHALCWKLTQSRSVERLFCCPGNAGIAQVAECVEGDPLEVAIQVKADFVVVGPDDFLAAGLVDELQARGIAAFGPTRSAARLESSKIFCKRLLQKHDIPTGDFWEFDSPDAAKDFLCTRSDFPLVVKADGLALGKGVVITQDRDEALAAVDEVVIQARGAQSILIEEFLQGEEVSLLALTDGESVMPLAAAQDHKRVGEGDTGANTGGMGCYSPVPQFAAEFQIAVETILKPTLRALQLEGIEYRGVLYAGLMMTTQGIKVLEYNCRFGDPETQVILPRMTSDLLPLLLSCTGIGAPLRDLTCQWTDEAAMCVVMASGGYPGAYSKGKVISGLDSAQEDGALVFHSGTTERDGQTVTNGGRVLGVSALGADFQQARDRSYCGAEKIHFQGAHFRRDIGWRAL